MLKSIKGGSWEGRKRTLIPAISPGISSIKVTLYPRRWAHDLYICKTIDAQSMLSVPPAPAWTYIIHHIKHQDQLLQKLFHQSQIGYQRREVLLEVWGSCIFRLLNCRPKNVQRHLIRKNADTTKRIKKIHEYYLNITRTWIQLSR